MPRRAPLPCEKSVSTFYCPSLSQTSTVGKVSSVKLFHKLSKSTASRKPTKTSSLQARNYQTTSAVSNFCCERLSASMARSLRLELYLYTAVDSALVGVCGQPYLAIKLRSAGQYSESHARKKKKKSTLAGTELFGLHFMARQWRF